MRFSPARFLCPALALGLTALATISALALEKGGMPDLGQQEQTCLPTSTANLIIWFGTHGYPNLIVKGDDRDDDFEHTVHAIMAATKAEYRLGTRTGGIMTGIRKYITDAGYGCDVEYRGLDWGMGEFSEVVHDKNGKAFLKDFKPPKSFTQDWLKENDDPNKGFILMLAYCSYDKEKDTFTNALGFGHAMTLVNAAPNMILVHDPAHDRNESGRKILTPQTLTSGTFRLPGLNLPVAGLVLLSGSQLQAPPETGVVLSGAICITMYASKEKELAALKPSEVQATAQAKRSWGGWLFQVIFGK